jgi:group I intron endonuclease
MISKDKVYQLYCITNLVSGRVYIGQTCAPLRKRWNNHVHSATAGHNFRISKAIRKYGKHNFKMEVLEVADKESINDLEKYFIKLADSVKNGYNVTAGGVGNNLAGHTLTEAHKLKIKNSLKLKTIHPNSLKALSDYHKKPKQEKTLGSRDRQREVHRKPIMDDLGNVYYSMKQAADINDVYVQNISRVLRGLAKTTGGRSFKYVEKI